MDTFFTVEPIDTMIISPKVGDQEAYENELKGIVATLKCFIQGENKTLLKTVQSSLQKIETTQRSEIHTLDTKLTTRLDEMENKLDTTLKTILMNLNNGPSIGN